MKQPTDLPSWSDTVAGAAVEKVMIARDSQRTYRIAVVCLTLMLIVAMVCGTVIALRTITEQQYALNAQYAQLYNLLAGAEMLETGDNGTIVQGDGNTTAGGDYNG